ncbi:MAG: SDR family NAD(P)-dependent oxidoreductase [Pirellulaceae bacterium]|nr:SDR family NAD(P)-dependent oxidoreductase [Pirellulaceae bacterium]
MPTKLQPIAVIGFAFRFPKGLESLDRLREALFNRFSAIDKVPASRWSTDWYYSSNPTSRGKAYIQRGGFLSQDISQFDANFFGISPRDAENMDPQQRLLLEVVWEAFENSGLSLPDHAGRPVGVYMGGFMLDHMISQMATSNRSQINQHTAAGMMMTMLSNRVSHTFDLRGPSLSIDTACSSSLVAFHYACQDIWRGAADVAVVGGANVMTRAEYPMGMCKGHFLSRDGECKSFDARGDGYGRGEGAAAVLLKPLANALADGDDVLATVIGTGTNQDGRTPGISMPSRSAQQALIQRVCEEYQIDPRAVGYVECHGTGTAVGDPTETHAIGSVYGAARRDVGPVVIGSIKSNIGHTEAMAGVAGIIKAVVTTMDRQAYPLANLQTCHPDIPFDELNLRISDAMIPLGDDFCAAVNSFGYGGSNAHVVLQTANQHTQAISSGVSASNSNSDGDREIANPLPYFMPLSARSPKALAALAGSYAELLSGSNDLADILYSTSHKRAHLSHRAVVSGRTRQALIAGLEALRDGQESSAVVQNTVPYAGNSAPVFVFTGMGPQWWAMGQELYRDQSIYRQAVEAADQVFIEIAGWSILAEMLKSEAESRITQTEFAQPANFMVQIGLLATLRAAGVQPGAVVGHSVGELASAYAAGVLSLRDALTVCYHRSQLQGTCRGTGGMLAVAVTEQRAGQLIATMSDRVSIAAINGPTNLTLAGDIDCLIDIAVQLTAEGVFNRRLDVEVPYHSPMMLPIMGPLQSALASIQPSEPSVPLYSTVSGQRVSGLAYGADYWPMNVRQPVLFAAAIQSLLDDGYTHFIEVGPHPVLATSLADCIRVSNKECRTLHTLRRNQPELPAMERAIMSVHASGARLDWHKLNGHGRFVPLPNYPWQRERYWLENPRAVQDRIAPVEQPILGMQEAPGAPHYRNDFDHEPMAYLHDHVVTGMPVLPASAYVEALLELAGLHFEQARFCSLRDLRIQSALLLNPQRATDFVTDYDPLTGNAVIRSLENGTLGFGQIHVQCRIADVPTDNHLSEEELKFDLAGWQQKLPELQSVPKLYENLAGIGLTYGPAFQTVREIRVDAKAGKVLSRIELKPDLAEDLFKYKLHPTLLDACFHSLMTMLDSRDSTYLPTGLRELNLYVDQSPAVIYCLGERVFQDQRHIDCDLTLVDEAGNVVATIRGMRSTATGRREQQQRTDKNGDRVRQQVLNYEWIYSESVSEPKRLGHWLVVGGRDAVTDHVADQLQDFGAIVAGVIRIGSSYRVEDNRFEVCAADRAQIDQVLSACGELDGVVFTHGLESTIGSADPTAESAIAHMSVVTQALQNYGYEIPPRVYVVTRNALPVKDHDPKIDPAQAAINGYVRVAFNELDGFRFSSIDLASRAHADMLDRLTIELLGDAEHDEVAFRGSLRYISELADSRVLSDDRIAQQVIGDQNPIQIRALKSDSQSVGSARLLATELMPLPADHLRMRIESMIIPRNLLLDPNADTIDQPLVEIVGRVLAVGAAVKDLQVGDRVCGFAPSDLCSHMSGPRSSFHLATIDEQPHASRLAAELNVLTRAQLAVQASQAMSGDTALIELSDLGCAIAELLIERGVTVVGVRCGGQTPALPLTADIVDSTPESLQSAFRRMTHERGFALLAVGASTWLPQYGLRMLQSGGTLIDLDPSAAGMDVSEQVGMLVRTDLAVHAQRGQRLEAALRFVLTSTKGTKGTTAGPGRPVLDVSISDVAWRKLPLGESQVTMTLTFDSGSNPLPVVQPLAMRVNPNGTYLVTGGLGGFGQKTAQWLVNHGARSIVLTGRKGADTPDKQAFVDQLRTQGAFVRAVACDGADRRQVEQLLSEIDQQMPPLVGIYHSAAVIIDQMVVEMDLPTFYHVMRNKALAAWHLHELTQDRALEQFVMYSSVANLVGNSRQAAYSAANGFLNGLAHYRRSLGLPGTSVNWGVIGDVGVVAHDEKLEQYLRYTGMRGLDSSEALSVLEQALARDVTQFGLVLISSWSDWARFETHGSKSPRFATLIASDAQGTNSSVRDAIVTELVALGPDEQLELLSSLIVSVIAGVLKADPDTIAIDRKIEQLGVDSLMATEIQMLLDNQLGLSVSVLELIGDATIRSLTQQSLKTLLGSGATEVNQLAMAN